MLKTFLKLQQKAVNPHIEELERAKDTKNEAKTQLKALQEATNPHKSIVAEMTCAALDLESEIKSLESQISELNTDIADSETLQSVLDTFRATSIESTVLEIESATNLYLSRHFDAEIKIALTSSEGDKIEVEIFKGANSCSFSQLSKGQRQLLKLCFGLSIMRSISARNGLQIEYLFLDEALDGLDDAFKVKAFSLLNALSLDYKSIFVVEHNEAFKSLFASVVNISLIDGVSSLNEKA